MTRNLNEIIETYNQKSCVPGGTAILSCHDSIDLILDGLAAGGELLGVESFRIVDTGAIQPEQEFSTDITGFTSGYAEFIIHTLIIIRMASPMDMKFEVVWKNLSESVAQ
jgi:hypothetical protein